MLDTFTSHQAKVGSNRISITQNEINVFPFLVEVAKGTVLTHLQTYTS